MRGRLGICPDGVGSILRAICRPVGKSLFACLPAGMNHHSLGLIVVAVGLSRKGNQSCVIAACRSLSLINDNYRIALPYSIINRCSKDSSFLATGFGGREKCIVPHKVPRVSFGLPFD